MILTEFKSIDSEHQLFRDIKGFEIASRIERIVYNRRKRKLFPFMEEIRMKMVEKFNEFETFFVVASMPLEVCKISRSSRSKICKEKDFVPLKNIQLETPKRKNQKDYKPQFYPFKKYRKWIETLFSQLCDQSMIRRNYAKTFQGYKTRILTKITTFTAIQYLNRFVFNRNINKLKINLVG